jgi:RecA-family ATPase
LRLEKTVAAIRPALVIIENAADVYGGNEVDRSNVTRFMRSLLGRLTVPCESTVMLIQHPSVSGLNDGTGRSGSTGWNNAGRWRNNFTKIKDDEGLRQYEVIKNNYGPDGEKVRLCWDRGVFVPESSASEPRLATAYSNVDQTYLDCLDACTIQGVNVFALPGRGHAPKVFAEMPAAKGTTAKAFTAAQARLFHTGKIENLAYGPPSKGARRIARKEPNSEAAK